ncbi:glycosyltransferase family 4 protein [Streptococcus suis]|uniref:glycosyltransferase family 4 protein n=1 Tax=Streptococcus suis TaxID=1307 RepID=UPI000C19EBBB|nr:glycosyltransferase family 4 protein [Streptococcus suis]
MKILVISNMFPSEKYPSYGIFVKKFCNQLNKIGISYSLSVMTKSDSKIVKVIYYLLFYLRTIIKILFYKYDLIYIHYASHSSIPVLIARPFINKKILVNVHGSDVVPENNKQQKLQKVTKKILSISDKIIVPSEYFRDYVSEKYLINSSKIEIYPSAGIDSNFFNTNVGIENTMFKNILKLKGDKKIFGFSGRISEGKGWDTFLNAIDLLNSKYNDENIYIILGDGYQSDLLKECVESKRLTENFIFINKLLPQNELGEFFNLIDYLVFPTKREGESLGLVALEAMACGTPVITSDFAAPKYYINDGYNGFKFTVGSEVKLAETIYKLRTLSSQDYDKICKNAQQTAEKYYEENIINELKRVIS